MTLRCSKPDKDLQHYLQFHIGYLKPKLLKNNRLTSAMLTLFLILYMHFGKIYDTMSMLNRSLSASLYSSLGLIQSESIEMTIHVPLRSNFNYGHLNECESFRLPLNPVCILRDDTRQKSKCGGRCPPVSIMVIVLCSPSFLVLLLMACTRILCVGIAHFKKGTVDIHSYLRSDLWVGWLLARLQFVLSSPEDLIRGGRELRLKSDFVYTPRTLAKAGSHIAGHQRPVALVSDVQ